MKLTALRISSHLLLGDLYDEIASVYVLIGAAFLINPVHPSHDIRVIEILPGKIDGNGHQGQAVLFSDPNIPAYLPEHAQIQFVQQVIFLQSRDELRR